MFPLESENTKAVFVFRNKLSFSTKAVYLNRKNKRSPGCVEHSATTCPVRIQVLDSQVELRTWLSRHEQVISLIPPQLNLLLSPIVDTSWDNISRGLSTQLDSPNLLGSVASTDQFLLKFTPPGDPWGLKFRTCLEPVRQNNPAAHSLSDQCGTFSAKILVLA